MKIPETEYVDSRNIEMAWDQTALRLSIEFGVYVKVAITYYYGERGVMSSRIDEIKFQVMDHYFDGEKDLRTALNNKAFL
jgi:hypothetical protein